MKLVCRVRRVPGTVNICERTRFLTFSSYPGILGDPRGNCTYENAPGLYIRREHDPINRHSPSKSRRTVRVSALSGERWNEKKHAAIYISLFLAVAWSSRNVGSLQLLTILINLGRTSNSRSRRKFQEIQLGRDSTLVLATVFRYAPAPRSYRGTVASCSYLANEFYTPPLILRLDGFRQRSEIARPSPPSGKQ